MNSAADQDEKTRKALRLNALLAGFLGLVATVLLFLGRLPFPRTVAWFSLFSVCCYFTYFFAFKLICRHCYRVAGVALSQIGALIISVSVYYTGGAVSPLAFLYMAVLVSEAIYGLENKLTVPVSAAGYLTAVWGIYYGVLPNPTPWAAPANASPAFLVIISALLVSYLAMTKNLTGQIISHLRAKIESEATQKDALLGKFSELNSTAQLGVLAHRIAHDLRGPIASVSGYLELAALKQRTPEEREELRTVSETVDSMVATLHGITRFGKPGGPSEEKIHLPDFMRDIVAIAAFAPRAKGVRLEIVEPGGDGLAVTAARADLQQAFFNVIKNAVEAVGDNPDDKHVRITIARAGKDARVTVADNGPGISEETLNTVFRKPVTTKHDGTGIGLLITRDLLVRNRGEIRLRNGPGGGLTVEAVLPLA
ncbi:MAG: HAMP domain-containing sensor histidine kinase [Elusimicrobiales bacterium]|nr:HAMP domain-containing sensor histidine kinase [Elusimicrobiales bacterium]